MPKPATASRFNAVRRSRIASCSAGSPASGCGRRPTCSSTRSRSPSRTFAGSQTRRARAVAGFTLTSSTPLCRCSALSASQLQAAQRMPSSSTVMERAPAGLGARQALDELRPVIGRPAIRPRGLVGAGRGCVAVGVVVVETGAGDELRDGLAAVAADRFLTAGDVRVDHDPGGNRLAAVEAGRTRPGHGARCVSVSPHFMTTPSFTQSWRTSASGRVIAR